MKYLLLVLQISFAGCMGVSAFAQTPTPSPTPVEVKKPLDACKLPTMSPAHAAWKEVHC